MKSFEWHYIKTEIFPSDVLTTTIFQCPKPGQYRAFTCCHCTSKMWVKPQSMSDEPWDLAEITIFQISVGSCEPYLQKFLNSFEIMCTAKVQIGIRHSHHTTHNCLKIRFLLLLLHGSDRNQHCKGKATTSQLPPQQRKIAEDFGCAIDFFLSASYVWD